MLDLLVDNQALLECYASIHSCSCSAEMTDIVPQATDECHWHEGGSLGP